MRQPTRLAITGLFLACLAAGASSSGDPNAKPVPDTPPSAIPLLLETPVDREAFWQRLLRPDLVVVAGERFQNPGEAPAAATSRPPVVVSVAASGRVDEDWARFVVDFAIVMDRDESAWATIRLDGLTVASVTEAGHDLLARVGDDRSWQVELSGKAEHRVVVEVMAPVRGPADSRRVELAIPPAASTRVDLVVPRDLLAASTGMNEPATIEKAEAADGPISRFSARLSPRPRIELSWRERANPAVLLPTLLTTQGEIAVEVERGFLRTRGSWIVSALRGMVDRVSFRTSTSDEILDVEVEGEPVAFEGRVEAGRTVVSVPLGEPLRPDRPRRLQITTRRSIASGGMTKIYFHGFTFDEAKVQTGFLAITRAGPLFPVATSGRGLRRIDPRTELPESLRTRPDILMAYEFTSQPFELNLQIDPAPPTIRAESRATVAIRPRSATIDARLECRVGQGRPFDLAVGIPRGLNLLDVGPPEVVASTSVVATAPDSPEGTRLLTIVLTRAARESEAFTLALKGRCEIDPSRPVAIPLFQPRDVTFSGGSVVVLGDRDVAIDPSPSKEGRASPFQVEWGTTPAGWEWPSGLAPGLGTSTLWFRHDAAVTGLPVRVTARPLAIRHESLTTATIDRKGIDLVDEVSGTIAFGSIAGIDVVLPVEVPTRWEVDGIDPPTRELLGRTPEGARRYRLRFAHEQGDSFRLRLRYRLPFAEPIIQGRETGIRVAPIRVVEGVSLGHQIRLWTEPGLSVEAKAPGWITSAPDPLAATESGPAVAQILSRPDDAVGPPIALVARADSTVALPASIASRVWLRTLQRPDGDLETTAWYRIESRESSLDVALPPGSRWIRARVGQGGSIGGEAEILGADQYRIRFPAEATSGPALVGLEYVVPASTSSASGILIPPRLLGGGVIQQTSWEVQVIGTRVGVGVPAGWTDENEWYRDGVLWKRRPWKGPSELAAWVAGPDAAKAMPNDLASGATFGRHGYLFSRAGAPAEMPFRIESRFVLVGLCSGPVLAVGLLILARRPPARPVVGGLLVLAFLAGTLGEISVVLLVIQSASLGVALMAAAVAIHWWSGRRDPVPRRSAGPRPATLSVSASTTGLLPPSIASDESTTIRPPPAPPGSGATSTADRPIPEAATITAKSPIAPSTASLGPR